MPAPPIQVFLTTIITQPVLKKRQEYILRILQTRKILFTSYDLASDEAAKTLWKRKAPIGKQELPGILVGGQCPGPFAEFEEAVEFDELDIFLRRNEDWNEELSNPATQLPAVPIGVPGAYLPSETKPVPSTSPAPAKEKYKGDRGTNTGDSLSKHGSPDIEVSDQKLVSGIKELSMDDTNNPIESPVHHTEAQPQTGSTQSEVEGGLSPGERNDTNRSVSAA